MKIIQPSEFQRSNPKASVVIPIFAGEESPNFPRIIKELRAQTFQDFELIFSSGVSPNGRARNEGVARSQGEYLIFIDETIHLTSSLILENLIRGFLGGGRIGVVGASCGPLSDLNWIQRQYFYSRGFEIPQVDVPTSGARVQHGCMAIPRKIFIRAGGESDRLITGTDNDLFGRLKRLGLDVVRVPQTHVLYEPPRSFNKLLKKSFNKGKGSAFAFKVYPGLFELSERFKLRNSLFAIVYKTISLLGKFFRPSFLSNPVILCCEIYIWAGFIAGCIRWAGERPDIMRDDLRWKPAF